MKIALIELFDPIPISSGGNWYSFQLLNSLGENNEVTQYFTKAEEKEIGYLPLDIKFKREFLKAQVRWDLISKKLEMIRPDILWNKSPIKNIKADIVLTIAECYHIGKYISDTNKGALVLLMHNIEWEYLKNINSKLYLPMKIYEEYILSNVDAVITISQRDFEYAIKYAPIEKVFYIPPNTDTKIFNPVGPRYDYGSDKFNLVFYGSLDRETNIEALKFIKYKLIPVLKTEGLMKNVRINVFGSGHPPNFLCLGEDKDINFIGSVEDTGKYIRGADAIIVPVKNASGVKIRMLESLACGKSIIANPEAVAGLADELKKFIFVRTTANEFVDTIKEMVTGKTGDMIDENLVEKYTKGKTVEDVIQYIEHIRKIEK